MQPSRVNRDPDRSVADRLHSAAIHLLRRLRREDEAMGLTAARASALSVLVFGGRPVTLGALAQAEQVSAPTVTRLIVGMERDGLVRREPDRHDGRVAWLHATTKGARLLHAGRRRRVAALEADMATLAPAARATLAAASDILERMLRQEGRKAGRREGGKAGRPESRKAGRQDGRRAGRPKGRKATRPKGRKATRPEVG
jgi:DNA-binding MarR family transcriptional regulator